MRVSARMNFVTEPGLKNTEGSVSRPKNMSSFE
jgi:hypothetical protein